MTKKTVKSLLLLGVLLALVNAAPIFSQDLQPRPLPNFDDSGADTNSAAADAASTLMEKQPNDVLAPDTQVIQLNFNPIGTGRCEVVITTWPEEAETGRASCSRHLVNPAQWLAAHRHRCLLDKSIQIYRQQGVCWRTVAFQASTSTRPGAPQQDTLYPLPLANQLSGSDLNGANPDMQCRFNANRIDWYMNTDGIVPAGKFDLVSTAMHEIGHGLGFSGTLDWDNGVNNPAAGDFMECNNVRGSGCYNTPPLIYDRFVQTTAGTSILSFSNNSTTLGDILKGDALVFNGANAKAANGGAAPRLFAPDPWEPGGSYQHLREDSFQNVANGLMTPYMPDGTAIHHPGIVALGMLKDMGWEIYDLSITYVDKNNNGLENGGVLHPFNTAFEGVSAVPLGGRVFFFAGDYPENLTISRPMTLESIQGTVVIGQ